MIQSTTYIACVCKEGFNETNGSMPASFRGAFADFLQAGPGYACAGGVGFGFTGG